MDGHEESDFGLRMRIADCGLRILRFAVELDSLRFTNWQSAIGNH